MFDKFLRALRVMELEEKILHFGVLVSMIGIFIPWIGGQWYGSTQNWNGFGFHTGYIGHIVFCVELFLLIMTLSPILGGAIIVRKSQRKHVRLLLTSICSILLASAFTVLIRLTYDTIGAEIRFGIYVSFVGSAIATLYAFLEFQEEQKNQAQALFLHPDQQVMTPKAKQEPQFDEDRPPPPPPPAPMPPEDHNLFSKS